MNKNEIMNNATKAIHRVGFSMRKHSPEILIVAGIVGTVASTVMACHATTKVSGILEKAKEDVDKIHSCETNEDLKEEYSTDDAKKDLAIVYIQTGMKLVKLYAPAVTFGMVSIGAIVTSNNILRKRNVALAAAYATVDKGFKEYRARVVERFGEQVDRELKYNIKAKRLEGTTVDEETGKKKRVKTTVDVADPDAYSDYAVAFDEKSGHWEEDSDYNRMFLRAQQNYANDKLKAQGYLFLNDVYDMLDMPRTKAGQIVGWIYDPNDQSIDNYVDFGLYETNREKGCDGGYEKVILLDFNVDGNIWDKCW